MNIVDVTVTIVVPFMLSSLLLFLVLSDPRCCNQCHCRQRCCFCCGGFVDGVLAVFSVVVHVILLLVLVISFGGVVFVVF
jgi:hypothetical protein